MHGLRGVLGTSPPFPAAYISAAIPTDQQDFSSPGGAQCATTPGALAGASLGLQGKPSGAVRPLPVTSLATIYVQAWNRLKAPAIRNWGSWVQKGDSKGQADR